jgi:HEAT repeat protein
VLILTLALVLALQDDSEAAQAVDRFKAAIKAATQDSQKSEAVTELCKTPHAKTLPLVVAALQNEGTRIAAARGLVYFINERKLAVQALVAALPVSQADVGFTATVLRSLGEIGDPTALPSVQRFLIHKEFAILWAAIDAAGKLPSASSIDPLIAVLKRQERVISGNSGGSVSAGGDQNGNNKVSVGSNRNARETAETTIANAEKALSKISGETFRGSKDWESWWNKAKPTFKGPPK